MEAAVPKTAPSAPAESETNTIETNTIENAPEIDREDEPADMRLTKLAERVRRLEDERPLSRAETIANWSTVSEGMTLGTEQNR